MVGIKEAIRALGHKPRRAAAALWLHPAFD